MPLFTSKFRSGLDNLSVDLSQVAQVKLGAPNPHNPKLWVLYFIGLDDAHKEKVIRTWFYQSETNRNVDIERILKAVPQCLIK
jgi:hypothetical protein